MQEIERLERELAEVRAELETLREQQQSNTSTRLLQRVMADRLVLEHLPQFVCLLDRNQRIMYLSRTIPGRQVEMLLGMSALQLIPPDDGKRYLDAFERAWTTCQPTIVEYQSTSGRCWQTHFVPYLDSGKVELMLSSSLDVTDRVGEQKSLREFATRLRHAIDVAGMGTWTRDWRTDSVAWDDAMCVLFGVTQEGAPKTYGQFLELLHPEDRARVHASISRGCASGEFEIEFRVLRPSGELRHVRAKGAVQYDAHGEPFGTLGAAFDVTDRKRMEEQLYQRQKMEAVGELTAGVAHNFNNLLSVIIPNIELCMEDVPPHALERLADAEHAAQRAADLVRQLMLFARREKHPARIAVNPVDTVRRVAAICRTTFDPIICLEIIVDGDIPNVLGNPGQLEQVLLNICINARDALMDARTHAPQVDISVSRTAEGDVRIRVRDNGPGMDERTRSRVFEPFYTTKEVGRGTGLGLASAYAIVSDHGGRMRCEAEVGRGATFEIELPGISAARTNTSPEAPREVPQSALKTILLVDDEELVRRTTGAVLSRFGYQVVESCSGEQALALISSRSVPIDLIVLDRLMPGLSGESVLDRIREVAPELPVVLFSGQPFETQATTHAAAELLKPVNKDELLRTLRTLLHEEAR
jgi:two-component system, cell cycle sensor histidine kinase and response regulator CckA